MIAVFLLVQARVQAASDTWVASNSSGSWKTAGNWSLSAVPGASDNIVLSGSSGSNPWTLTGITMEVQDITYSLSGNDRRLRNDSSAADSLLILNGGGMNGGLLINLTTSRNFSIQALGGGATPHQLAIQLKTSGTFNSSGTFADSVLGGSGLVINAPVTESGGSRSLTLSGAGVIALSGTNSYSGGTIINMSGGTVLMSGSGTGGVFNGTLGASSGSLTMQNGTLDLGTSSQRVGAAVINGGVIQSGTLTADSFTANISGSATIGSVLAGIGGLSKTGAGRLVLSASSNFTGNSSISGGTLVVSGNIAGSSMIVNGGTLRGSGVAGVVAVQMSGTLGAGTETVTGNLTVTSLDLQTGAHLAIRLGGTTAGGGYDRVSVANTISLAGDLQGELINGFVPAGATWNAGTHQYNLDGDKFFILLGTGVTGTFSNAGPADPNLPGYGTIFFGGREFAISYNGNAAENSFTGGGDTVLMAIPEPASWVILFSGAMVMAGTKKIRRRKQLVSHG